MNNNGTNKQHRGDNTGSQPFPHPTRSLTQKPTDSPDEANGIAHSSRERLRRATRPRAFSRF
jgi:hypothetical protein